VVADGRRRTAARKTGEDRLMASGEEASLRAMVCVEECGGMKKSGEEG